MLPHLGRVTRAVMKYMSRPQYIPSTERSLIRLGLKQFSDTNRPAHTVTSPPQMTRAEFEKQMKSTFEEVERTTQKILYGVTDPPDARRRYEAEFGPCKCTPKAIETLLPLSPLVQVGAGRGHWEHDLTCAGADVVAYEDSGVLRALSGVGLVGRILPGGEDELKHHADKTLLLVYPPPGETALRWVEAYEGDDMVYVGEGRDGLNACDEFFDKLDEEWEVTTIMDLDPFPQCYERLYVLRRKTASLKSLSA